MSSASSTDAGRPGRATGFRPRHLYLLMALAGATWAVIVADDTHPAALLLLSAAVLAAGIVGAAMHGALAGFFGISEPRAAVLRRRDREAIEADKALVLRAIKELEFDRAMRKVSDADFAEIGGRLRARAMSLMEDLDRMPADPVAADEGADLSGDRLASNGEDVERAARFCGACGAARPADARFCPNCGVKFS